MGVGFEIMFLSLSILLIHSFSGHVATESDLLRRYVYFHPAFNVKTTTYFKDHPPDGVILFVDFMLQMPLYIYFANIPTFRMRLM